MKRTWTIEVDITEDDRVPQDENEEDVFVAEMEYWAGVVEIAIDNIKYLYQKQIDEQNEAVDYAAIDFVQIRTTRS